MKNIIDERCKLIIGDNVMPPPIPISINAEYKAIPRKWYEFWKPKVTIIKTIPAPIRHVNCRCVIPKD